MKSYAVAKADWTYVYEVIWSDPTKKLYESGWRTELSRQSYEEWLWKYWQNNITQSHRRSIYNNIESLRTHSNFKHVNNLLCQPWEI